MYVTYGILLQGIAESLLWTLLLKGDLYSGERDLNLHSGFRGIEVS